MSLRNGKCLTSSLERQCDPRIPAGVLSVQLNFGDRYALDWVGRGMDFVKKRPDRAIASELLHMEWGGEGDRKNNVVITCVLSKLQG